MRTPAFAVRSQTGARFTVVPRCTHRSRRPEHRALFTRRPAGYLGDRTIVGTVDVGTEMPRLTLLRTARDYTLIDFTAQ